MPTRSKGNEAQRDTPRPVKHELVVRGLGSGASKGEGYEILKGNFKTTKEHLYSRAFAAFDKTSFQARTSAIPASIRSLYTQEEVPKTNFNTRVL